MSERKDILVTKSIYMKSKAVRTDLKLVKKVETKCCSLNADKLALIKHILTFSNF